MKCKFSKARVFTTTRDHKNIGHLSKLTTKTKENEKNLLMKKNYSKKM